MTTFRYLLFIAVASLVACGDAEQPARVRAIPANPADIDITGIASVEIEPGLDIRRLLEGNGAEAVPGDMVSVNYTGWLHDESAPNYRGQRFDSSDDHGAPIRFRLGEGRVIQGWDKGVAGMRIGEVRELTIAPELAYGDRQAGPVIGPGSTLVFVVQLAGIDGKDGDGESPQGN